MTLAYAGTELTLATEDISAWIADAISPSWLCEAVPTTWPGRKLSALPWRGYEPTGPVRVGVLSWPAGAARWAWGHYLCDEPALAVIRQRCFTGGWTPAPLTINDGQRSITTSMYCLPPRHLSQVNSSTAGLHLLSLVDARYLWWFAAAEISVVDGVTTWEDLYATVAEALAVDIAVDTIAEAYLGPDAATFNAATYRSPPMLLDAIAACCGQRIVRSLDGSIRAMNPDVSLGLHNVNIRRESNVGTPPANLRIAGRPFDFLCGQDTDGTGLGAGGSGGLPPTAPVIGILDFGNPVPSGLLGAI